MTSDSFKKTIKYNSFEDCCRHKILVSENWATFLSMLNPATKFLIPGGHFLKSYLDFSDFQFQFLAYTFCFCPKHCNFFIGYSAGWNVLCGWHILGIFTSSPNCTPGLQVTLSIWKASFSYIFPKCCTMNYKLVVARIYQLLILIAFLSCYPIRPNFQRCFLRIVLTLNIKKGFKWH